MSLSSELAAAIEDERAELPTPAPANITIGQRMLSACLGSLVTSFAVTPFDVVRIRIHQQEVMNDCCSSQGTLSFGDADSSRGSSRADSSRAGSLADSSRAGSSQPISSIRESVAKARAGQAKGGAEALGPAVFWNNQQFCETARNCPKITSTFQGMVVIGRNEGMATLWRGLSLTLLMAIPSNIIYFTGYEYIKEMSPITDHTINPLVCGLLARMMSATVVLPIELLKTRFQSVPNSASDPKHKIFKSLLRESTRAVRQKGFGSMFTGLQITLWRDVPFLGIYWMCYEYFKVRFSRSLDVDFDLLQQEDWKVFAASFCLGSLGGVVAAFFTNPFDVGKTRLQIAGEKSTGARPSMFQFLWQIRTNEGIGALYKGFAPRVFKIAPSCAIMISSYEIGKKLFKDGM